MRNENSLTGKAAKKRRSVNLANVMNEQVVDLSSVKNDNNYKIGETVLCSYFGVSKRRKITVEGKEYYLLATDEVRDALEHKACEYARGKNRIGIIQYLNDKIAIVRHTDNLLPEQNYEDAFYLFDEIKKYNSC